MKKIDIKTDVWSVQKADGSFYVPYKRIMATVPGYIPREQWEHYCELHYGKKGNYYG